MMLDRIFKVPSDWIKALSPIIIWMTLHVQDNLTKTMFELVPEFNQELSRLHELFSNYIGE